MKKMIRLLFYRIGRHPDYEINYLLSLYLGLIYLSILTGFDTLFCLVSLYIISKMKCCGNSVAKIGSSDSSDFLYECAKSHRDAIKMIRTCSEIFKIVALVQLFCSMSLVCFILFYVQNVRYSMGFG
jgi:hypothetical protein